MKKSLLLVLIILLSVFIAPTVYGANDSDIKKRCYYQYYSYEYGFSYTVLVINGDKSANAYITTFNSNDVEGNNGKGNVEGVNGWDYNEFQSYNGVCPYYAAVDTNGTYKVTVSYNIGTARQEIAKVNDQSEAHVLMSTTIKADKESNGDIYDEDNDNYIGVDSGTNVSGIKHLDLSKPYNNCSYILSTEDRKKGFGYTEASLFLGFDTKLNKNTAYAAVHIVEGNNNDNIFANDEFEYPDEFKDPDNIMPAAISSLGCPAYMIYDNANTNSVMLLNDKKDYVTKRTSNTQFVLIRSDLVTDAVEFESSIAHKRAKDLGWETTSGNEDPFAYRKATRGDNFCSQAETRKATRLLGFFVMLSRAFIPILVIIWGVFDFTKVVTQGTTDSLKKDAKTFGVRVLLGLFIFFVPTIIYAIFNMFVYWKIVEDEYMKCANCIFHPFDSSKCNTKVEDETADADATTSIKNVIPTTQSSQLKPGIIIEDPDNKKDIY